MKKSLTEILKNKSHKSVSKKEYISSLINEFETIKIDNYLQIIAIANMQYEILLSNENFSGFYIVDWRVNFANLSEFIENPLNIAANNQSVIDFIKYYDSSAETLYRRLNIF